MGEDVPSAKEGLMEDNNDAIKRGDQVRLLTACASFTETGVFEGMFTYPDCGWDLVQQGLATEDRKITMAGKAVLWLLEKGPDPTKSKAVQTFKIPIRQKEE